MTPMLKLRGERGVWGAIAVGVALYVFFALTTSRIPGYGFRDGKAYAKMALAFDPAHLDRLPAVIAPANTRYLPSAIAHYLHPDPTTAFTRLNAVAILLIVLACYGILRFYGLSVWWSLVGLALYLVAWPGLRFWIYYPILTDQLGTALLLSALWAVLHQRHLLYTVTTAALMATRESGAVVVLFFLLFHANPWNPHRDLQGSTSHRWLRLAAWNLLPLAVLLDARCHPFFPQSNTYNMTAAVLVAVMGTNLSAQKQLQCVVALLSVFGVIPYVLWLTLLNHGLRRAIVGLRAHWHWVVYVLTAILLAPLSWTDQERFLILAVPPLMVALAWQLQARWPVQGWASVGAVLLVVVHASLTQAFKPLQTFAAYEDFWSSVMSDVTAQRLLRVHLWLTIGTCVCVLGMLLRKARRR